jgi:hypothetical protein
VEAEAVESQFKRAGFHVASRTEGPHYVALGLVDASGLRTAIRIVASRGTILSLDSEDTPSDPRHYRLLAPANLRGVRALPAGEVFVQVAAERADEACIAGFRIGPEGTLSRIVIDAGAVTSDGCASELQDADADGAIELVVHAAFAAFSADDPPLVRVPLVAHGGGYRWVEGVGVVTALLNEQRVQAERDLVAARRALDVERAYRSAAELAVVARFQGDGAGAQLKVFDDALRGLVLTGPQAALIEHARRLIREGRLSIEEDEPLPAAPVNADAAEEVPVAP